MTDVLVSYFSRSGSTERVARNLAENLGADIDPIRPVAVSYAGAQGYARALWHSLCQRTPDVAYGKDPPSYALVIVGTPVWAGRPSAPVRSYLMRNRGRIGAMAGFCVSGSGAEYTGLFREIERLTGRPCLSTMSLAQRHVLSGAFSGRLQQFAERIRDHLVNAGGTSLPSSPPRRHDA